jgi:hypothetical protein
MRQLSFCVITGSALLLVASGCGGVRHTPVSGVVTMDQEAYGNVVVSFVPADGANDVGASGKADDSGKFQMGTESTGNGVKPGKYKVTVQAGPDKSAERVGHPSEAFRNKEQSSGGKVSAQKEYTKLQRQSAKAKKILPAIYADPKRSPLEVVEVTNEPKEIKVELKSDAH